MGKKIEGEQVRVAGEDGAVRPDPAGQAVVGGQSMPVHVQDLLDDNLRASINRLRFLARGFFETNEYAMRGNESLKAGAMELLEETIAETIKGFDKVYGAVARMGPQRHIKRCSPHEGGDCMNSQDQFAAID